MILGLLMIRPISLVGFAAAHHAHEFLLVVGEPHSVGPLHLRLLLLLGGRGVSNLERFHLFGNLFHRRRDR